MASAVFDTTYLTILLDSEVRVPTDPATQRPYELAQERIEFLIETLQEKKTKIILPCPALAEFLIMAYPDGGAYLQDLKSSYRFEIAEFDEMAAIELAELAIRTGKPKKKKRGAETWAKLQYDRQIIAIALARGAKVLYSTDDHQRSLAQKSGIEVFDLSELPLAPPKQHALDFQPPNVVGIDEVQDNKQATDEPETGTTKAGRLITFEEEEPMAGQQFGLAIRHKETKVVLRKVWFPLERQRDEAMKATPIDGNHEFSLEEKDCQVDPTKAAPGEWFTA